MRVIQRELKRVREEWQETWAQIQAQQEALQAQWRSLTLKTAQLQGKLDHLDEDICREPLILGRAVRHLMDNLQDPITCPISDIREQLDTVVELNLQSDS